MEASGGIKQARTRHIHPVPHRYVPVSWSDSPSPSCKPSRPKSPTTGSGSAPSACGGTDHASDHRSSVGRAGCNRHRDPKSSRRWSGATSSALHRGLLQRIGLPVPPGRLARSGLASGQGLPRLSGLRAVVDRGDSPPFAWWRALAAAMATTMRFVLPRCRGANPAMSTIPMSLGHGAASGGGDNSGSCPKA